MDICTGAKGGDLFDIVFCINATTDTSIHINKMIAFKKIVIYAFKKHWTYCDEILVGYFVSARKGFWYRFCCMEIEKIRKYFDIIIK